MLNTKFVLGALAKKDLIHPISTFSIIWVFVGLGFLAIAVGIVGLIFYLTRKKPIKTLASLKPSEPKTIDIDALRKRYLALVSEVEQQFSTKTITPSITHQRLSMIVRLFYAEVSGLHAEFLTLNDLKRTNKKYLTQVINEYYPDEFDLLEKGPVASSIQKANNLIMNDEVLGRHMRRTIQPQVAPTSPSLPPEEAKK